MTASATDKFRKGVAQWSGNIGSAGVADAVVTTIPLASASNLPTDTAVMITVNRVDTNGVKTGNYEGIVGVVSGNNLINCIRGVEGTAQAWTGGTVVEILHTASNMNELVDGLLVEHGQDGKHTSALVTTLKATGAEINTGTEDGKIVTPKAIADSKLADFIRGDGWISANETWTYNAPDKLNVPSGAVTKYAKGDRLKFQNNDSGTNIYVAVVGVTNTVLTVFPASVPNATLSDNFYSHEQSPIGYPHWFAFVPTTWAGIDNGSGGAPTISEARVRFDGNKATCHVRIVGTKDITSTTFTATVAPLPAINATNNLCALGSSYGYVNGTTDVTGIVMINTVWSFLFNISLTDNWSFVGGATWSYEF